LLDIFNEMEEKSLPLIQKSQYTSEKLDQIHSSITNTQTEHDHQVEKLQLKLNQLENLIHQEISREISCQNLLM
jgi:3-dehydroquinate dehydratase